MSSVNKVILVGRLGSDPEIRHLQSGSQVANFTMATSEKWTDKTTGEKKEKTEWHRIVLFNRLAEIAGQYLSKGSLIYIEGKLQTDKWTDNEGNTRYTTKVQGFSLTMLSSPPNKTQQAPVPAQPPALSHQGNNTFDDDIPF